MPDTCGASKSEDASGGMLLPRCGSRRLELANRRRRRGLRKRLVYRTQPREECPHGDGAGQQVADPFGICRLRHFSACHGAVNDRNRRGSAWTEEPLVKRLFEISISEKRIKETSQASTHQRVREQPYLFNLDAEQVAPEIAGVDTRRLTELLEKHRKQQRWDAGIATVERRATRTCSLSNAVNRQGGKTAFEEQLLRGYQYLVIQRRVTRAPSRSLHGTHRNDFSCPARNLRQIRRR